MTQWLAWQLATGEVPGSNPGQGDNLLISDLNHVISIVSNEQR